LGTAFDGAGVDANGLDPIEIERDAAIRPELAATQVS
jgi:hypothetical protein